MFAVAGIAIVSPEQFAQRFRELAYARGLSQVELAKLTGFTQSSISEWLSGKKEPKITAAKKIAAALSVRVEELFILPTSDPGTGKRGRPRKQPGSDTTPPDDSFDDSPE